MSHMCLRLVVCSCGSTVSRAGRIRDRRSGREDRRVELREQRLCASHGSLGILRV